MRLFLLFIMYFLAGLVHADPTAPPPFTTGTTESLYLSIKHTTSQGASYSPRLRFDTTQQSEIHWKTPEQQNPTH